MLCSSCPPMILGDFYRIPEQSPNSSADNKIRTWLKLCRLENPLRIQRRRRRSWQQTRGALQGLLATRTSRRSSFNPLGFASCSKLFADIPVLWLNCGCLLCELRVQDPVGDWSLDTLSWWNSLCELGVQDPVGDWNLDTLS